MAQADQVVQNDNFPTVRADINNNLAALFTNSSGSTAPTVTVAYQDWIDTSGTDPVWKKRNAANNAWITVATIKSNTVELAADNVLPPQSGQSGNYLTTNGTVASWGAIPPGSSVEVFTSSGTWVKPSSGTVCYVELWGAGGSGCNATGGGWDGGGGGGGARRTTLFSLSDLPATVSVTIGAGGAAISSRGGGASGGSSLFGLFESAGGNGGVLGTSGGTSGGSGGGWPPDEGGGGSGIATKTTALQTTYKGAGGGRATALEPGGSSLFGGGGGGGKRDGSSAIQPGGVSTYGGNGGQGGRDIAGQDGQALGGGGGATGLSGSSSGSGGRGECRVYVW
jgi:hypothetical protein